MGDKLQERDFLSLIIEMLDQAKERIFFFFFFLVSKYFAGGQLGGEEKGKQVTSAS